jgi:1,2-dihydroxy-3-keto-5-methylthiopentene dioxygenase
MDTLNQIGVDDVVKAWYMDDLAEDEDQRLPHHRQPNEAVPLAKLLGTHSCKRLIIFIQKRKVLQSRMKVIFLWLASEYTEFGIVALRLDAENHEQDENLKTMREGRGYLHMVCHSIGLR